MSLLKWTSKWTSKSTAKLASELVRRGFTISDDTVGRLLKRLGYTCYPAWATPPPITSPNSSSPAPVDVYRHQARTRTREPAGQRPPRAIARSRAGRSSR
jgi:hypothetical protein